VTLAGSGAASFANGIGTLARFNGPSGVSVRESTGVVYVADRSNYRVRAIAPGAAHAPCGRIYIFVFSPMY
jgi:DNA-binding beta-propeller fold protein YncE